MNNTHLSREPRAVEQRPADRTERAGGLVADHHMQAGDLRPNSVTAWRNVRMMRLLERIAMRFDQAGVSLMALKGAALNLLLLEDPAARPMVDLDLLVRPEDADRACHLLERMGGLRGEPLVREDFFPKYHYEVEYTFGPIHPVKIDLHVRPFRPLRYAQFVPDDALWARCRKVPIGFGSICVPSDESMLIHLAVHAAVHGAAPGRWLRDVQLWIETYGDALDWFRVVTDANRWGIAAPLRRALRRVLANFPKTRVPDVMRRLLRSRPGWRDALALWQAPRDADRPLAQLLVNLLCTPGLRFRLGYLQAIFLPHRIHMADWYGPPHRGWLVAAHLLRWLGPVATRTRWGRRRLSRVELRPSPIHGVGVFATSGISTGEVIAQYCGRPVDGDSVYAVRQMDVHGDQKRYELTGRLRHLNHSCSPNACFEGFRLVALRPIARGHEITIDYGDGTCNCHTREYKPDSRQPVPCARVA
jgi:hypothetical protein